MKNIFQGNFPLLSFYGIPQFITIQNEIKLIYKNYENNELYLIINFYHETNIKFQRYVNFLGDFTEVSFEKIYKTFFIKKVLYNSKSRDLIFFK